MCSNRRSPVRRIVILDNLDLARYEILLDGDSLKVECGPAKYTGTLTHWNNGAFVIKFPGATEAPTITTFEIGEDGTANNFTHEDFGVFTRVRGEEQGE